jgi:hypothetical protein
VLPSYYTRFRARRIAKKSGGRNFATIRERHYAAFRE